MSRDQQILEQPAAPAPFASRLIQWLASFRPAPMAVNAAERWRASLGAVCGIAVTTLLCRWLAGPSPVGPWLVAPVGASAVLVFAAPASPLAQPWSVIGGNTISAMAGIACARWIPDPALAGALAVSLAIAAMFALRCLHPPGGAMALIAVLTHATWFHFALFPALINSTLLVAVGIAYNSATRRRYPHTQLADKSAAAKTTARFSSADLDAVLARYNQVLDVSRDDLEDILRRTEMLAMQRRLGELRCADIMSKNLITVDYSAPLEETWSLMRRHRIKALPVVDRQQRIIGIVTLADFMRHANVDTHAGLSERLRTLIRRTTTLHSDKPEVAGQIMCATVRVASADRHASELMPLFSEAGHHHIPIVGENNRLVGIITESDFVRALYRTLDIGGDAAT